MATPPPAPNSWNQDLSTPTPRFERFGIRYGLFVGVGYIAFFLLMKVLGLHEKPQLAYLNGIILAIGVVLGIKAYKTSVNGNIDYLPGIGVGFMVSLVSSIILGLFFIAYSSIDKEFVASMQARNLYGLDMSVIMTFLVIIMQGTVGGTIIGFIAMQYFKRADHRSDMQP